VPEDTASHREEDARARRTLVTLVVLTTFNHVVFNGSRIAISLFALGLGAAPTTVGVLMALYGLLPMGLSIRTGRAIDRIGVRTPMVAGSVLILAGALIVPIAPVLATLFASATLIGTGFMLFQIAQQNIAGYIGRPERRALNFSVVSLGMSVSNLLGPLLTGVLIDHVGFTGAFVALCWMPLVPIAWIAGGLLKLPEVHRRTPEQAHHKVFELLSHAELRYVFMTTSLTAMGWDLYTFVTPIYGTRIGLSATQIGTVIGSFALATFLVRLVMPIAFRHLQPWHLLRLALALSAAVYFLFPLTGHLTVLMLLSFLLGIGLGSAQPMIMALLHQVTPHGRVGEAVGLRATLVNTSQTSLPLVFGFLGTALGMLPVFWVLAGFQLLGSEIVRRHNKDGQDGHGTPPGA
jgi:predicted MFS family arabinose efflux permease